MLRALLGPAAARRARRALQVLPHGASRAAAPEGSRSYSPASSRAVEFTQGGPANAGRAFQQPGPAAQQPAPALAVVVHDQDHQKTKTKVKKKKKKKKSQWVTPSSTQPDQVYHTHRLAAGVYRCNCPGFRFRKTCRHVKQAQVEWSENEHGAETIPEENTVQGRRERSSTATSADAAAGKEEDTAEIVCGVDEAGAGPVIGPLVVCAVVLSQETEAELRSEGVRDSKDVSKARREVLSDRVKSVCENHHVARVEAHEIDARRAAGESMNAIKMASIKAVLKEAAAAAAAAQNPLGTVYRRRV